MKKFFLITLVAIGLVGFSSYYYIMNGGARDLQSEKTAFSVTASEITSEFNANLENSNKKYLEKPIAITGTITALKDSTITLDHTIICMLKNPDSSIKNNQKIILKGRVVGYDDLMGELKLDQCFIIK